MARNNNKYISRSSSNIKNIAKGISGNMDALYRNTYMTNPQQNHDLDDLSDRINKSIDGIVDRNIEKVGMPSITKLYSRLGNKQSNGSKVIDDLEKMFDNGLVTDDLYGLFMSNRYLKELDNEIDTVCKYMPKLEEALAVQKDCILSADHFSKDFLNFDYPAGGDDAKLFAERSKDLKKKYDLARLVEEIYEDTSKYGEKFIYRVPYSTAIGKLLANKPDNTLVAPTRGMHESVFDFDIEGDEYYLVEMTSNEFKVIGTNGSAVLSESFAPNAAASQGGSFKPVSILQNEESFHLNIELCKSGILESAVKEAESVISKRTKYAASSLSKIFEQQVLTETKSKNIEAKGNIDFGSYKADDRIISSDGLIGQNEKPVKIDSLGCVIKKCPREQVLPIYIEDICMGYYYFELRTNDDSESFMGFKNILGDPLTNMRGDKRCAFNSVDNKRQDETIRYIAGQLSSLIDKQFVNANQDMTKEIYMILKYNDLFNTPSIDTIKVTFIPPEDMVHFFFKQDPVTHRGISDLEKGLIPAKIYSSLYITNAIAQLTRGQDKRVYYVKQTVDTNIAQTLLNTIQQIKQSNFGIRQFQNINNILNITGRFNDYVIPTNASGDPPIQFEVMPGQDIKAPTELMDALEEMAINSTGIPIEIIQARQSVDYAIQLTMSSSKVLRFCYKRQELFQDRLTELISPIYNYEYNDTAFIKVVLPPPGFINITNTNQLIDNTKGFVQSIVDIDIPGDDEPKLKSIYFKDLFKKYIGTHLDVASHEQVLSRAKIKAKQESDESHSEDNDQYGY